MTRASRRPARPLAASGALALALVVAPVAPAAACACGGVAPVPGSEVEVGREHAIVSYRDGVEQIDLLLGMLSVDTEAGLVVPTPAPATVSLGELDDFREIDLATRPRRVEHQDWWTWRDAGDGSSSAGAAPDVLERVQLGPIEAVTLAADDAEGLQSWLAKHDYGLSPEVAGLLRGYVDRGWYFVALRLSGDAPLDGDLDPLRFRFETDELVYPLELSRAASTPQTVRLHLFGEHRQRVSFVGGGEPGSVITSWAAPVTSPRLARFGDYLTVVELYFADPGVQIRGDLAISDAPSDATTGTEYYVSVPVAVFGIPLGWVLVVFGAFVVVGLVAVGGVVGAKRS